MVCMLYITLYPHWILRQHHVIRHITISVVIVYVWVFALSGINCHSTELTHDQELNFFSCAMFSYFLLVLCHQCHCKSSTTCLSLLHDIHCGSSHTIFFSKLSHRHTMIMLYNNFTFCTMDNDRCFLFFF
jgi:hypothetical protein